ncbi:MAG: CPBP family intramembrane metalloprotease [Defluviitaleaceae bacterium]|nr:CPBP family intramembrane metalloprotease [Defluviitaleaceae bacterium]
MDPINLINSALFTTFLLLGIPYVWWYGTARGSCTFFVWVGLKKVSTVRDRGFVIPFVLTLIYVGIFYMFLGNYIMYQMFPEAFGVRVSSPDGLSAWMRVWIWIIRPLFLTGFLEEVGFRGVIGKRLISRYGFVVGNTAQAVMFGLVHNFMGLGMIGAAFYFISLVFFGWVAGYITEKKAGGSIVPAVVLHAVASLPINWPMGIVW